MKKKKQNKKSISSKASSDVVYLNCNCYDKFSNIGILTCDNYANAVSAWNNESSIQLLFSASLIGYGLRPESYIGDDDFVDRESYLSSGNEKTYYPIYEKKDYYLQTFSYINIEKYRFETPILNGNFEGNDGGQQTANHTFNLSNDLIANGKSTNYHDIIDLSALVYFYVYTRNSVNTSAGYVINNNYIPVVTVGNADGSEASTIRFQIDPSTLTRNIGFFAKWDGSSHGHKGSYIVHGSGYDIARPNTNIIPELSGIGSNENLKINIAIENASLSINESIKVTAKNPNSTYHLISTENTITCNNGSFSIRCNANSSIQLSNWIDIANTDLNKIRITSVNVVPKVNF